VTPRALHESDFVGPIPAGEARLPAKPGAFVARTGDYTRFVHVWNGSLRLMSYVCFANVSFWIGASYLPIDGSGTVEGLMAQAELSYLANHGAIMTLI
jgi:hypothetical protein